MTRWLLLPGVFAPMLFSGGCRGSSPPEGSPSSTAATTTSPKPDPSPANTPAPVDASSAQADATDSGLAASAPRILTRGARLVVVEGDRIFVRRHGGGAAAVDLARVKGDPDAKLSATIAPFLGRGNVLDVTIIEKTEHGWHHASRETHYLLEVSATADTLGCTFAGAQHSGGEYSSETTSIEIKAPGGGFRTFDVARTTTSRASQPRGSSTSPPPTKSIEHYELGAGACMGAAPTP